jgi:hypothetical protein
LLCLLTASLVALSGSAYCAEKEELPDVPKIAETVKEKAEETAKSKEFKEFKKAYQKRVKEAQKLIEGKGEGKLQESFNAIRETYFSKEFQQRIEEAKKEVFGWTKEGRKYGSQAEEAVKELPKSGYYLYAFLSKSMGSKFDLYLKDLDLLIEKQGEELRIAPYAVIRGVIRDKTGKPSLKATVLWLRELLSKHKVQLWIDPLLFRKYGVSEVPCIALVKNDDSCPQGYIGCGYSVFGFLRAVENKTNDKALKELLRRLD